MPRAVTPGTSTCTGRRMPSSIGPICRPSAAALSRLSAMFAASSEGKTSRFAAPSSGESATASARSDGASAASACISPSTASPGARSRTSASAWRIRRAEGAWLDPKEECDSSATFGAMPKARTCSAARHVISHNSSAVGSSSRCVSTKNRCPAGITSAVRQ